MQKFTIVVCDHIHKKGLDLLAAHSDIEMINVADKPKDELIEQFIPLADVAITRSSTDVDEYFLKHATKMTALVRAGVGVDNVDIRGCSKQGIVVMNVPTANTIAAVEMTMVHLLSCVRQFPYVHNNLKQDRIWHREDWYGTELKNKKFGIIGFGNIGSRVGKRARAFDMDIVVYDPYIDPTKATDMDIEYTTDFDDILACDIITIHTPKNSETVNMITSKEIAQMKDGVILINCARGGLYNEKDLYDALKSGKVAMAGLDVFDKEPATDNPLLDLDNVTVTPHIGANTIESQQNIAIQAAENAILAARGISYPNAMNLPIKESELPDFVRPYLELAQKIGYMGAQLSDSGIKSIKMSIEGPVGDYIDSLSAFGLVGALCGELGEEKVNYVNAKYIAKERDIDVIKEILPNSSGFKNLMTVRLSTIGGNLLKIGSTVFGESEQRIVDIDGYTLDLKPKGRLIMFKNNDEPGVIGDVGHLIARHDINISDFRLGRDGKGQALAVVRVDDEISKELLTELAKLPACISVRSANI